MALFTVADKLFHCIDIFACWREAQRIARAALLSNTAASRPPFWIVLEVETEVGRDPARRSGSKLRRNKNV
jgi:hypothetical protein